MIIGTNPQRCRATAENGENSPSGKGDPSRRRRRRKHVCWLKIKFRFFCRHAKYIILQKLFLSYTKYFLIWRLVCICYKISVREGSNPQIHRDYETAASGHGLTPSPGRKSRFLRFGRNTCYTAGFSSSSKRPQADAEKKREAGPGKIMGERESHRLIFSSCSGTIHHIQRT